ncbi:MAG TPA: hypothetical protein DCE41_34120 [Cytophagales bacterium]|nr:hypothetical protein [Cytophagales bacterium]HAA20555.1 hypothetical protein [Cytophagales bacterium]HAP61038.1 hypothetical protein [Cytophagales bacterium]
MELLPHTLNWCKGEMMEARYILGVGVTLVIISLCFHLIGTTPASKAMLWPLLVTGILFVGGASGMLYKNKQRLAEYPNVYEADPAAFVQAKKARADNFIGWYPRTRFIMIGVALLGMALPFFSQNHGVRSIGLILMLIALAAFVIDHFSEERANVYYEHILEAEKNT